MDREIADEKNELKEEVIRVLKQIHAYIPGAEDISSFLRKLERKETILVDFPKDYERYLTEIANFSKATSSLSKLSDSVPENLKIDGDVLVKAYEASQAILLTLAVSTVSLDQVDAAVTASYGNHEITKMVQGLKMLLNSEREKNRAVKSLTRQTQRFIVNHDNSVSIPAGRYFVGDPCYFFQGEQWDQVRDTNDYFALSPILCINNVQAVAFQWPDGNRPVGELTGNLPFDTCLLGLIEASDMDIPMGMREIIFNTPQLCCIEDKNICLGQHVLLCSGYLDEDMDNDLKSGYYR